MRTSESATSANGACAVRMLARAPSCQTSAVADAVTRYPKDSGAQLAGLCPKSNDAAWASGVATRTPPTRAINLAPTISPALIADPRDVDPATCNAIRTNTGCSIRRANLHGRLRGPSERPGAVEKDCKTLERVDPHNVVIECKHAMRYVQLASQLQQFVGVSIGNSEVECCRIGLPCHHAARAAGCSIDQKLVHACTCCQFL